MKYPPEKLFFVTGVDGSGKTTITHEVMRICQVNNIPCQNLWSRFNNYFSLPLIGITKLSGHCYYKKIMGKPMGFHDYENLTVLRELFFILQIIDVNIATFFHIIRKMNSKTLTICERGPYDTFVDVLADTKLDSKLYYRLGKMFSVQIDRKNPIVIYIKRSLDNIIQTRPELIYDKKLPFRIKTYECLARKHKWLIVDNNGSLSETQKKSNKSYFHIEVCMKPIRSGWRIWPIVIIIRYWIIQGMMFMNNIERIHRLFLEFICFIAIYLAMQSSDLHHSVLISLVMAHSLSFLCNGHLFAMLTHDLFWYSPYKDKNKFLRYLDGMYDRMNAMQPAYVEGVVFFGSLARGVFRETSDLDVRFISKPGFWNGIKSSHLVFQERFRALLAGFPIDTYMFASEEEVRSKMDVQNEHPVSLYTSNENLKRILPETQSYTRFKGTILQNDEKNIR